MTATHPQIARIRKTIKTVADDVQAVIGENPDESNQGMWLLAGVVIGLAAASRVVAGDSATKATEAVEQAMHAGVGKAVLDGKINGKISGAAAAKETPDA
jgi:hypothetical protein